MPPLKTLSQVLEPILSSIAPVAARSVRPEDALGKRLAQDVVASRPMPQHSIALRAGFAVSSLDVAGASAQSPVILSELPPAVMPGDPLPAACDAVLDATAVMSNGAMTLATDGVTPGANARLRGQDLPAGALVACAGCQVTPEVALACRLAGIDTVWVRAPAVMLELEDANLHWWLSRRLASLGCDVGSGAGRGDCIVTSVRASEPRLALQPGETAWCERADDGTIRVELPSRWDGAIAAYSALLLPVAARLLGAHMHAIALPLTRKIVSSVGLTEVALLRTTGGVLEPLATGDITLATLAQADAFSLIEAGSEGYAAGESVAAFRFEAPLG